MGRCKLAGFPAITAEIEAGKLPSERCRGASPDYYGDEREGDNLFTNFLVALDADTGKLRWYD